jgi:hypothetical protein
MIGFFERLQRSCKIHFEIKSAERFVTIKGIGHWGVKVEGYLSAESEIRCQNHIPLIFNQKDRSKSLLIGSIEDFLLE